VTLTVTDSVGRSNTASQTISVTSVTLGVPNITVSPTPPVAVNQQVFFTSTTTIGSNGRPIVAYTWNFGDGTNASGQNVTHVYTGALTYTVLLTVADDQGHTSSATTLINVQTSPIADFTITPTAPSAPTGTTASVVFDGSVSKTLGGGTIVSYSWKDSVGRTATGPVVTGLFFAPGTYTMTLTVADSAGNTGQVTKSFTVAGT
jgi:PKD repeat protein